MREPGHFCGYGGALLEGFGEAVADVNGAANSGEERGLE